MSTTDKKEAVIRAAKSFSKRQIDVPGKGKCVMKLEKGENVTEEKLDEMYQRVLELQRQNKDNVKTTVDKTKTIIIDKEGKNKDKIHKLELENATLKEEVEKLQQSFAGLESKVKDLEKKVVVVKDEGQKKEPEKENKECKLPEKLYGFSIIQKKTSTGGRMYHKWYAHRRIEDKQHWIYLGEDSSKAESKVKEWLEKNYPGLLK